MGAFHIKRGFLLGLSGSPTQLGGIGQCSCWKDWYEKGYIIDGLDPVEGTGHADRWRSDIMLVKRLGAQCVRIGADWSAIEPEENKFDESALIRLKEEILLLKGLNVRPMLTLYHSGEPMWFLENGGWEDPENIGYFLDFVEKTVGAVGHLVSEYMTFDEPEVCLVNGYMRGVWPPGKKLSKLPIRQVSVLVAAHLRAYRLIHKVRRALGFNDVSVGYALRAGAFDEPEKSLAVLAMGQLTKKQLQDIMAEAMSTGGFRKPLKNFSRLRPGKYCDFCGVTFRTPAEGTAETALAQMKKMAFPEGVPIYITDDAIVDSDDSRRAKYICGMLEALQVYDRPVLRYYHRFIDGFEWTKGGSVRCGLVRIDFDTMDRTVKESGEFFHKITQQRAATEGLCEKFTGGRDGDGGGQTETD